MKMFRKLNYTHSLNTVQIKPSLSIFFLFLFSQASNPSTLPCHHLCLGRRPTFSHCPSDSVASQRHFLYKCKSPLCLTLHADWGRYKLSNCFTITQKVLLMSITSFSLVHLSCHTSFNMYVCV